MNPFMRIFLILCLLIFGLSPLAQAERATICVGNTVWVPEINDCAIVEEDESDRQYQETVQKAEDAWAKIQAWYGGIAQWKDRCFSPTKTPELPDPSKPKGTIQSLTGRGFVTRGIETLPASTGMELMPGDIISLEENSTATLDLRDTGVLKITQKTKFQIPNTTKPKNNFWTKTQRWAGSAWQRVKKCTSEPRKIKDGGSVGGVRG